MNLQERKTLLLQLGQYMLHDDVEWVAAQQKAFAENAWFIPEFVSHAVKAIATNFLTEASLQQLADAYQLPQNNSSPKKLGLVMAGNIPLVGFHDFLMVFMSGHYALVKPSSKDDALIRHLIEKIYEWNTEARQCIVLADRLNNCDAYIATGSNNTSRYFEYYFRNQPHIVRRNRTSVAVLSGNETADELAALADDVYLYFGLGCRNVTQIFVPDNYDFISLLKAFEKWSHSIDCGKYKNNYDYNLAIQMLNNKYYMTNGSIILVEEASPFSPISQLHYQFYSNEQDLKNKLGDESSLQCIVGRNGLPFGVAQAPTICQFADGVDTLAFLLQLS